MGTTTATTTIVDDGQYRWTINAESLVKGLIANGYHTSKENGWPIAVDPGGEAYSDLCSEVGYEWSSGDGPEDRAKIDAIEEAETMTYREDWRAWELSPGLHAALWNAEAEREERLAAE